jgi:hypothetical protein
MDSRSHNGGGSHDSWPQSATTSPVIAESLRRSVEAAAEREQNARSPAHRPLATPQSTIRTVTPEPAENGQVHRDANMTQASQAARGLGISGSQTSPRSIPGGELRRQGIVFNDPFGDSYDSSGSSPPTQPQRHSAVRPRTHTMDGAVAPRQQTMASSTPADNRHRVGSFSSSGSTPLPDADGRPRATVLDSMGYTSVVPGRAPDLKITVSSAQKHEKRSTNRRLIKRNSSRPTSPLVSPIPSVDSLPLPIPTHDANRVLILMRTLCGRMKGEVQYQAEPNGTWYSGICYIDEERGSLLFESGQGGSFHLPLISDLRGCRVLPIDLPDIEGRALEIVNKAGLDIHIQPLNDEEYDAWLAALLCWQQVRPSGAKLPNGRGGTSPSGMSRAEMRRRGSATPGGKDATIIKVGKVMLWDKGTATSPRAIVKRPSTRDLRGMSTTWVRVSCILQDNGAFKLMTENDVSVLSVIELSQLSRSAVQRLDKSVLDEEYCIGIFPIYASTSKQLSIFRPVFLALDTRVLFEVWFVLLRAFAVPELYGIDPSTQQAVEITDFENDFHGQMFRLEKTVQVRVTEAKLGPPEKKVDQERYYRNDRDPTIGNYLAEVILDGEVRARTTTQADTNKPFWREAAEFNELSSTLPYLTVVLKRVEGNLENLNHQVQASLGLPKNGNLTEHVCGAVDISLDKLERGRDHEQWHQIHDEKNESIGTMFVKINHEELVVLMANDYRPLSDLLHKFSSGITNQIAGAMPQQLRRLADIFINIFQASGRAMEWLSVMVEDEIDGISGQNSNKKMRFSRRLKSNESGNPTKSDREQIVRDMGKSLAGEANLLFRGNTLLTQALECHMRRLGKDYLEEVLGDKIFEINELNPDCEVDPSRITNHEDIGQHWAQLMHLTTEIWECIAASANKLPGDLRQVLKYIRAVAEDRYGDFLRTVTYTSVSGFLFLRFICPAILNPKLFGLLRDNPRPRAQRTLTLIAKGLQALGNLSTFGKKESWMEPMNKFLNNQRALFKHFIDQTCSIPSERSTAIVPATYTTPITILGRLKQPAREGFPVLPYLIDDARNFASLVKIWLEYHHASAAESHVFEGDLARFHEVCVILQGRADECMAKMEAIRTSESASVGTDDLADSMEKASLMESMLHALGSPSAWPESDPYRPPGSSGSEDGHDRPAAREPRFNLGRDGHSLRQITDSANLRKNGMKPRTFLSGLISGKRDKHSKNESQSSSMLRDKSRDKEDRDKKGFLGGLAEGWQGGETSKH